MKNPIFLKKINFIKHSFHQTLKAGIMLSLLCLIALQIQAIDIPETNIKWAEEQGMEFTAAYKLFLNAPMNNYNYTPAETAFKKLLKDGNPQQEVNAAYFLVLCQFSSLRFKDANKNILRLVELMKKLEPNSSKTKIVKIIVKNFEKGQLENIAQLKKIIVNQSYLKVILPGADPAEALMGTRSSIEVLSYLELLEKMHDSVIYANAAKKIAELKKGEVTEEQKPVIFQVNKHIAELQKCSKKEFLLAIAILALESNRVAKNLPDLKNSIGEAICAHNLKQIGMAFHLYVLDHGKFPVLQEIKKVKMKGKDADLRELWVDKLKPYFGIKQGNLINYYGIYRSIPEKSPFQCPAAIAPSKITSVIQYGYNCMWPFGWTKKTEANLGSGLIKYSMLKPEKHLLLADAWYFGSTDGRGSARLYTFDILNPRHKGYVNVLYADGHVNAENFNFLWEADTNGEPWNSNNPYKKRAKINLWQHKILEIE